MEDAKVWLEYVSSQMNKCSNRNGRFVEIVGLRVSRFW